MTRPLAVCLLLALVHPALACDATSKPGSWRATVRAALPAALPKADLTTLEKIELADVNARGRAYAVARLKITDRPALAVFKLVPKAGC